jgi:hypothetical protein
VCSCWLGKGENERQPCIQLALTLGQGRQLCNAVLCSCHFFKRHLSEKLGKALPPAFQIKEREANL